MSSATDTPPVIQINGDNPAIIQVGASYTDLGATITGPQADLNLGIQTYLNGTLESPIDARHERRRDRHHRLRRDRQPGPHEHLDSHRHRGARSRSAGSPTGRIVDRNDLIGRRLQFSKGERTRRCYDAKKSRRCG